MLDISSVVMRLLQEQANQVEFLGMAAVRCGYNSLEIEHASEGKAIPTKANPSKLLDGQRNELGRWWYDLEHGAAFVQATQPDVKAVFNAIRAAQ